MGETKEKGIKIFNIIGDIDKSYFAEYPVGTPIRTIMKELNIDESIVAAECGGMTERIALAPEFDKYLSFKHTKDTVPAGSIVFMNKTRNLA